MKNPTHNILIGGDVCPTASNVAAFQSGKIDRIFSDDLLKVINDSEGLIINLETPLVDIESPIVKSGPNLISPVGCVNALNNLPLTLVGLANNHILDQGEKGLHSTLDTLKAAEINCIGAGRNLSEAMQSASLILNGRRIGVYACAEHEFTIADEDAAGANPFDPLTSLFEIQRLSKENDRVIVLFHGMKEYYRYPSPETQRRCRAMVEAGASLVICQHSHCIGCFEKYNDSIIVYGQGDFCFPMGDENEYRKTGLLVSYDYYDNAVSYLPLLNEGNVVRLADDAEASEIMNGFYSRSHEIHSPGFIESNWMSFCAALEGEYTESLLRSMKPRGLSKIMRFVWRIGGQQSGFRSGQPVTPLQNILQCEAHREVLEAILKTHVSTDDRK